MDVNCNNSKTSPFDVAFLFKIFAELQWEEWGPWSSCVAHCKDGVGDRLQSRTRNKNYAGDLEKSSQTESRPCSSVQFDGNTSFLFGYSYFHTPRDTNCLIRE